MNDTSDITPAGDSELIYGIHAVQSTLKYDADKVQALYMVGGKRNARLQKLAQQAETAGVVVEAVSMEQLNQLTTGRHQGVVARCTIQSGYSERDLETLLADTPNPLLLVLDSVTDPHNLGACLRSADAAGVAAVIVPKDNSAPLNAVARKVAAGRQSTLR